MTRRAGYSAAAICLAEHSATCPTCNDAAQTLRICRYCPVGIALLHAAVDAQFAKRQSSRSTGGQP